MTNVKDTTSLKTHRNLANKSIVCLQDVDADFDENEEPDFDGNELEGVKFPNGSKETWRNLRHLVLAKARGRTRALAMKTLAEADVIPTVVHQCKKDPCHNFAYTES